MTIFTLMMVMLMMIEDDHDDDDDDDDDNDDTSFEFQLSFGKNNDVEFPIRAHKI